MKSLLLTMLLMAQNLFGQQYNGSFVGPLTGNASTASGPFAILPTGNILLTILGYDGATSWTLPQVTGPTIAGATGVLFAPGLSATNAALNGFLTNNTVRSLTQGWYATTGTPVTNGARAMDATIVFKMVSTSGGAIGAYILQTNAFDGAIETNQWGESGLTALVQGVTNTWKGVLYSNDVVNLVQESGTVTVIYSTEKPH